MKAPLPPPGEGMTELPIDGDFMAWTVDDGSDSEVIRRYGELAKETGIRITFFANGQYRGWEDNAALLRPMVDTGQIVVANHTYSHADLTSLSDAGIIEELSRNEDFIVRTFGKSAKPFYRPPYGYRNARTDAVAASIGYTTPVMWYGSLSDSGLITQQQVLDFAAQWFLPKHIVIGHANFPPVTDVFPQLVSILKDRKLQTVTMRDVYQV